jgi:hypothetical protein
MELIRSIEISYLRSIHRLRIPLLGDLAVFSGANDVGKSNILRALNLFFNNQVNWGEPIDFYQDFSLRRLREVRSETIKGKQFIRVSITFERPRSYINSLPPTFKVTRTWLRNSQIPQESSDLESQGNRGRLPASLETAKRQLSKFLGRIRFEYVPAVKDRPYFISILANLQDTLLAMEMSEDDPVLQAVKGLNVSMRERAEALRSYFESITRIQTDLSLPSDPRLLFRALSVATGQVGGEQSATIPLTLRGDGIQAVYVPALLDFVARNSSYYYIWGFEEPENSVEYNLAIDLARDFEARCSKHAQILTTTHSPAFFTLQGERTVCYRVYDPGTGTQVAQLHPATEDEVFLQLASDIGLFRIQQELNQQYIERRNDELRLEQEAYQLRLALKEATIPVVYLEGKTDVDIVSIAWQRLRGDTPMPFSLKPCDPLSGVDDAGGAGGASTLERLLSTTGVESKNVVIGIFDRDYEGLYKGFNKLPAYFDPAPGLEDVAKMSRNRKAVAICLPVPPGKEGYTELDNLVLEFYFDEESLSKRTSEGWGLELDYPSEITYLELPSHPKVKRTECTKLEARRITSGKTVFAGEIVPTLPIPKFHNFRLLFDVIAQVLAILNLEDQS